MEKGEIVEKVESQWTTLESGPLAGLESMEKAEILEKATSQWSTLSSGPLARRARPENGETVEKAASQWSTPSSEPLAGAGSLKRPKTWRASQKKSLLGAFAGAESLL